MNSKKKLFQNSIIYFIGNFATKILAFFMLPLYTRYLSPTDYGEFDLAQSFTTLLYPIIFIQISDAVIRMLLEAKGRDEQSKYISNAFLLLVLGTASSCAILPFVAFSLNKSYLVLFYIYFVMHAWHTVIQQIVRSLGYNKLYAFGGVISTLTTVALNLMFILGFGYKAKALFLSAIGTSFVLCFVMFFGAKLYRFISINSISRKVIFEMVKYSIPLIPNTLSWQMITTFSRLYLGGVCGRDMQGLFAVVNRFPTLITMVTGIFYLAWQEIGITVYNTDEKDETYTDIYNLYINALFAGSVVLMPLSKVYILYFLSNEYESVWVFIPIMIISAGISALNSFLGTAYLGKKNTKNIMYTSLISGFVNVIIVLLLTKKLGIWGVAIGAFAANIVMLTIRTIDVKKYVQIKINKGVFIKNIVALAFVYVLYYFTSGIVANILLTVVATIIGCILAWPIISNVISVFRRKIKNN
ncbi:MAG: lipopolysaccharide biosynthesis protein [Clostridia bacterium]|nr:lipopolysaccharide biosynthesis protein [Clostridia bacterium]